MVKTIINVSFLLLLLLVLAVVGTFDYNDAVEAEQYYCDMVSQGFYPPYDPSISCEK